MEDLPTGQKIIRLASVELLIAKHDVIEDTKTVEIPRDAAFGPGAGCFSDREVIRGVVDMVDAAKMYSFVVTHKGRVFMSLNAQLLASVKKGSVVEFTVLRAEKVCLLTDSTRLKSSHPCFLQGARASQPRVIE